jgi:hypothetical protein
VEDGTKIRCPTVFVARLVIRSSATATKKYRRVNPTSTCGRKVETYYHELTLLHAQQFAG